MFPNINLISELDYTKIQPIPTKLTLKQIVELYRRKEIDRDVFLGLMLYLKTPLFDMNYWLNEVVLDSLTTPKVYGTNPERVISIIKKTEAIGRRMTANFLRQQTKWTKEDCDYILNVMVESGEIKRVIENINGKQVTFYE